MRDTATGIVRVRHGRGGGGFIVVLAIVFAIVFLRRGTANAPDQKAALTPAAPDSTGLYRPATDEGIGAAIAILIDNSGSMKTPAKTGGDRRPKFRVAQQAIEEMLTTTDSFVAKHPGFPVKVGIFQFSGDVHTVAPIAPYDRAALRTALQTIPAPEGGTAIGDAMDVARAALYRAGIIRKYILVVTDGENTDGRSPRSVALEIARRSEGAVKLYFVAFDIDAKKFAFLEAVRGEVLGANNALALRASLDTIYRGRILAEATDAGERPTVRDTTTR